MPKKVSDSQKKEILNLFINGINLKEISKIYKFSLATIVRQLKNLLGDNEFNKVKINNNLLNKDKNLLSKENSSEINISEQINNCEDLLDEFVEVIPITHEIEIDQRKDLASEPLKEIILPEVVYMLVDKNIELTPKLLKDYPEWSFMPSEDLQRMTIEIFDDHKYAKKLCAKNQKLIKVPNSKVFLIASQVLKSKGISRIVFNKQLLSL